MSLAEIEKIIRANKALLETRFGVQAIGVFGSFARGEGGPHSDIDILVEFAQPVGWDFLDLKDFLEGMLGRRVDLVTKKGLRPKYRSRVLDEVAYA